MVSILGVLDSLKNLLFQDDVDSKELEELFTRKNAVGDALLSYRDPQKFEIGIRHAILISDECQLPAMVSSKVSDEAGFGRSFFESILDAPKVQSGGYARQYLLGSMFGHYSFISISDGGEELDDVGHSRKNMVEGTQTLGMYYARLRLSWEELSHYDGFIELPASAPSEKVPIPPTTAEIYAKIVDKTRVLLFLVGLNPNFEYARVHLLDRAHSPTLEDAHAYCLSDKSRRSPIPLISRIPWETSVLAIHYDYPTPPSFPS
ncbi:hypothetical protein GIB67_002518 [Kingdonia uniflora]|uniref:Uncharacterized protein n=1 Tax=Kingdonia uniflora TaxID=39325 RepID=A0A7J7N8U4_9MAGN|nr:hypothetical protein GIB67_002518 [Kingdonia uniflora]